MRQLSSLHAPRRALACPSHAPRLPLSRPSHAPLTPLSRPSHAPLTPLACPSHAPLTPLARPSPALLTPLSRPSHAPLTPVAGPSQEQYIHRIGRTARAGKSGCSYLLLSEFEEGFAKTIAPLGATVVDPPAPRDEDGQVAAVLGALRLLAETLPEEVSRVYTSWLGFYLVAGKDLGLEEEAVYANGKRYMAHLFSLPAPPTLSRRAAERLGLVRGDSEKRKFFGKKKTPVALRTRRTGGRVGTGKGKGKARAKGARGKAKGGKGGRRGKGSKTGGGGRGGSGKVGGRGVRRR